MAARAAARGETQRWGEVLLVIGLTVANPTLWATAFSLLIAIVPLWRTSRQPAGASATGVAREAVATAG